MPLAVGSKIAGFTVVRLLGEGGMGAVYLVQHPDLPRRDVLKVLHSSMATNAGFRARFEHEATLAARLDHPNIVQVYDRGIEGDQPWIRMQYVDGIDASYAVAEGPLDPTRVLHIVRSVGSALDYAHRLGLLHRDVKPANILLARADDPEDLERVLLTDFGIAKALEGDARLTATGQAFLSPAYCAPERFGSGPIDHRVDVYALGCVAYELLTGRLPYPVDGVLALIAAHDRHPVPDPRRLRPELPAGVTDVIRRAMAKDPVDRYPNCRALSRALQAALDEPPPPGPTWPGYGLPGPADPAISKPRPAVAAPVSWSQTFVAPEHTSTYAAPARATQLPSVRTPGRGPGLSGRHGRQRGRRWPWVVVGVAAVLLLAGVGVRAWALQHWFVGVTGTGSTESVAVFRGLDASLLGANLFEVHEITDLPVGDLTPDARNRVRGGITADDADEANRILDALRDQRLPICPSSAFDQPDTTTPSRTLATSTTAPSAGVDCREAE